MLGTYTGLYYVAGTLVAVVGPILNGWVIDLTGRNYNMIFLVTPGFFVLAIPCMDEMGADLVRFYYTKNRNASQWFLGCFPKLVSFKTLSFERFLPS